MDSTIAVRASGQRRRRVCGMGHLPADWPMCHAGVRRRQCRRLAEPRRSRRRGQSRSSDLTREPAMTAPVRQTAAQWARIHAAAKQARQLYPGPVGELVARELISYAELGWLVPAAMVDRLIRQIEETAA